MLLGFFYMKIFTTWDTQFYFHSKERSVWKRFCPRKVCGLGQKLNPQPLSAESIMQTFIPQSEIFFLLNLPLLSNGPGNANCCCWEIIEVAIFRLSLIINVMHIFILNLNLNVSSMCNWRVLNRGLKTFI